LGEGVGEIPNENHWQLYVRGRHLDKLKRVIKCSSFYL